MSNFENSTWRAAAIWKSLYLHISAANRPNCTKFSIQTQILPQATETTKKSEIRKFKMADEHRIGNHFLATTQLHVVPLRWNLEWGGRITRIRSRSGDQTPNYESPKQRMSTFWKWIYLFIWAANRPKLTKLVHKHKFWHNWGNVTNKSEINIKRASIIFLND